MLSAASLYVPYIFCCARYTSIGPDVRVLDILGQNSFFRTQCRAYKTFQVTPGFNSACSVVAHCVNLRQSVNMNKNYATTMCERGVFYLYSSNISRSC